jgi:hypothetical protein
VHSSTPILPTTLPRRPSSHRSRTPSSPHLLHSPPMGSPWGAFHLLDPAGAAWCWLAPYRIHEAEVAARNRASPTGPSRRPRQAVSQLKGFGGHRLESVSKEGLKLEEADDEKTACEEEAKSVIKDAWGRLRR